MRLMMAAVSCADDHACERKRWYDISEPRSTRGTWWSRTVRSTLIWLCLRTSSSAAVVKQRRIAKVMITTKLAICSLELKPVTSYAMPAGSVRSKVLRSIAHTKRSTSDACEMIARMSTWIETYGLQIMSSSVYVNETKMPRMMRSSAMCPGTSWIQPVSASRCTRAKGDVGWEGGVWDGRRDGMGGSVGRGVQRHAVCASRVLQRGGA